MNECPFCGGFLDCNSDDVWICRQCNEIWVRAFSKELIEYLKEFKP